jgi:hypothetical protein
LLRIRICDWTSSHPPHTFTIRKRMGGDPQDMAGTSDPTDDIEFGTLGAFAWPFYLDGVRVTWPKALAKALLAPGPLDAEARGELTRTLANSFPAYTGGRRASPG